MRNYKQEYLNKKKQDLSLITKEINGLTCVMKITEKKGGRELVVSVRGGEILHNEFEYTGLYNTNTYLKKILIREVRNELRRLKKIEKIGD